MEAVSLASSVNIATLSSSRFPVKLSFSIAFGSGSSFCCLLKSIAINL